MDEPGSDYLPIKDYAIIGDCGSAALVSRHGSIDWLCWPQFDSSSIFAAILDSKIGGYWSIRPDQPYRVERRYVDDTNVLETTFTTDTGVLRVTDLMPVTEIEAYNDELWPDHELLRAVECDRGEVNVRVVFDPRFEYGRIQPRLENRGLLGYYYNYKSEVLIFRCAHDLAQSDDGGILSGTIHMEEGDSTYMALSYDVEEPAVLPLIGKHARKKIDESLRYWEGWSSRCQYDGPFRNAVMRSALTLKLMTFSRSGAVVAAPTTSLPEHIGGKRNWDYRFCWLRDASFTLRALLELGYDAEGEAFLQWLLNAIGGRQSGLQILYDVYGNTHTTEKELDHLDGYKGSRPVRIGNGAESQFQLDIYGEIISAAYEFLKRRDGLSRRQAQVLRDLGKTICERWHEPDNGIWEKRSERQHHTYSKAMCWVGLKRLLELHEMGHLDVPADEFKRVRDEIRDEVEAHGFNETIGSYTETFDGDSVDASLLLLPVYGYNDATDERMRSTFEVINERLGRGSLLYRYEEDTNDGMSSGEGAFGICSFWDEAFLARLGKVDEAIAHFDDMMAYANDVGLFSEEIDVDTGTLLGNFPQAFTHVGLINAALIIQHAQEHDEDDQHDDQPPGDDQTPGDDQHDDSHQHLPAG